MSWGIMNNYFKSKLLRENPSVVHFFGNKNFITPNKEEVFFLHQVHSTKVVNLDDEMVKLSNQLDGDAIVTSIKGLFLGVKTADCVPILITSTSGIFVSAVHSGWRGTYNEIVRNVIEDIIENYKLNRDDLVCAIGPSIGLCCYEVSSAMYLKFRDKFDLDNDNYRFIEGKHFLNLANINKKIINNCGVFNVESITNCTGCDGGFFSYRADGSRDKSQISIIKTIR